MSSIQCSLVRNSHFTDCYQAITLLFPAIIVNQDFELDDVKESSQAEGISRLELDASRSRSQWYSAYDRRKNIRNKWNLFYTLVNNPSLVKLRKNYVESDDEEDDPDGVAFIATCREGSSAFYD